MLSIEWIINTLKKDGCNSKKQVIERLENADINELHYLKRDIITIINQKIVKN